MRYWVLGRDNQPKGPYPDSHILKGLAEKKVDPARLVCREGEQEWIAIRDVPEFNGGGSALPEMFDLAAVEDTAVAVAPPRTKSTTVSRRVLASAVPQYTGGQAWGMTNRRVAAFFLELSGAMMVMAVVARLLLSTQTEFLAQLESAPPPFQAASKTLAGFCAVYVLTCFWILVRDAVPQLAWGRRWLGLEVVRSSGGGTPDVFRRVLRNVPVAIGLHLIEYIVAAVSKSGARRLGDLMAGTCVIDVDPQGRGTNLNIVSMILACMATIPASVVCGVVLML